jgi:hypothetical protein
MKNSKGDIGNSTCHPVSQQQQVTTLNGLVEATWYTKVITFVGYSLHGRAKSNNIYIYLSSDTELLQTKSSSSNYHCICCNYIHETQLNEAISFEHRPFFLFQVFIQSSQLLDILFFSGSMGVDCSDAASNHFNANTLLFTKSRSSPI